jgi:hypothetical protein
MQSQYVQDFNNFVIRLGKALSLDEPKQEKLKAFLVNFSNGDKYKLISETDKYVTNLEEIDKQLIGLKTGILAPYMNAIQNNWNNMNEQLAQLQVLSLIQRKENCEEVIKELLGILSKKIASVNDILRNNLGQPISQVNTQANTQADTKVEDSDDSQSGGRNNDKYINKYLKYKNKYLSLKKKNKNIF